MTSNPLAFQDQESDFVTLSEEKEHFILQYVVVPGALGGLTKIIMEVKDSTQNFQTIQPGQNQTELNLPTLGYLVPSSIFLGIISSLIGMFVLSDFLDFKKSKFKIFGLSLIFGLFFPLVFEAASNTLQLQNQISTIQEEKVRVEEAAINNAMPLTDDPISLEAAIQDIEELAVGSTDVRNQTMAIKNIEELAVLSNQTTVSEEALGAIAMIARQSQDDRVAPEAIESIEKLALKSNQPEVKTLAVETLENLRGEIPAREDAVLDEAINRILSQS